MLLAGSRQSLNSLLWGKTNTYVLRSLPFGFSELMVESTPDVMTKVRKRVLVTVYSVPGTVLKDDSHL